MARDWILPGRNVPKASIRVASRGGMVAIGRVRERRRVFRSKKRVPAWAPMTRIHRLDCVRVRWATQFLSESLRPSLFLTSVMPYLVEFGREGIVRICRTGVGLA